MTPGYPIRCLVAALLVAAAGRVGARAPVPVPLAAPLDALPARLGDWRGTDAPPFDAEVVKVLAADDYVNRIYWRPDGAVASLFIAYYGDQRAGDRIHSPQHCLPGNGWQPVAHTLVGLDEGAQRRDINRYVVARREARQLVYYWFEGRGRVVASEYLNTWFLLLDGWRRGRSEGALVRLVAPLPKGGPIAERMADSLLLTLGRDVHAELLRVLP